MVDLMIVAKFHVSFAGRSTVTSVCCSGRTWIMTGNCLTRDHIPKHKQSIDIHIRDLKV